MTEPVNRTLTSRVLGLFGAAMRGDSWENIWTGFGTARDKTMAGMYGPSNRILDPELSALYHHDDIASRVVNMVPREMLRQGFGITCSDGPAAVTLGVRAKDLEVLRHVRDAAIWGRLFGGAVLLVGADDGQEDTRQPLNEANIRSLTFLQVYDRRRAQPESWYEDIRDRKFGEPKVYRLTNYRTGGISYVHESRLIIFRGAHTGDYERWQMLGWDFSVLQKAYEPIRQFSSVYKAAELLMTDASQGVFKMKGLLAMIAGGQLQDLQTRAQFLDLTRSITRAIMLDADGGEDFTKVQTSFAGIGDMLDRAANRLAAAIEAPVAIVMGQSPAGLQATGAADFRAWYDSIDRDRKLELLPRLERLVRLISLAERLGDRTFGITFPPLWQETPKEKADREKIEADTAKVWIDAEVLTPEEVSVPRFGGPEPQPYRIDPKSRQGSTEPTADRVLNGAQIQAAEAIVSQVVAGQLPRDSAIGQLQIMFGLSQVQAEAILGSAGKGFVPSNAPPTV